MTTKPTLGQILGMAGGLLLFIFGFLDWYSHGPSGWDLPIANWAPLLGIITAILLAVLAFAKVPQLDRFSLKPGTLLFGVGLLLTLDTFGWLIGDTGGSVAAGLILSFICALVMLAGGVLDVLGIDPMASTGIATGGYPPQAYGQPPAGYPQPGYGPPPGAYPQPGQAPPPPSAYPPPAAPPTAPPPNPGPPAGTETQVVPPNPNPGPPPVPGQGF
jgi:hypothetical protein